MMKSEKVRLRRKSLNSIGIFDPISAECDDCLEDFLQKSLRDSSSHDDLNDQKYTQQPDDIPFENKTYFICDKSSSVGVQNIPPPMHLLNLDRLMNHQTNLLTDQQTQDQNHSSPSYLNPILSSFEKMLKEKSQSVEHQFPQAPPEDYHQIQNIEISTRDSGLSSHSSNSGQDVIGNLNFTRRKFVKKNLDIKAISGIEIDVSKYKSIKTKNSKSTESIYDRCESVKLMNQQESNLESDSNTRDDYNRVNHYEKTLSPIWKRNPMRTEDDSFLNQRCNVTNLGATCIACESLRRFFVFRPTKTLHPERLTNALYIVEKEALKCESCWRKINQISVNLFNKNPKNGLTFYLRNLMTNETNVYGQDQVNRRVKVNRSVANFIKDNLYQLNTSNIGHFLGQLPFVIKILSWNNETLIHVKISPQKIVRFLMNGLQIKGCEIDEALRIYINKYALPSESQEINRVIQVFAEVYHVFRWDPDQLPKDEIIPLSVFHVYGIAYAIILLQTSLHNTNAQRRRDSILKNPMNDFIKSLTALLSERKEDDTETRIRQRLKLYSNKKLKQIYLRMQTNPFIFEDRQMTIMHKLRNSFTKSESLRAFLPDDVLDKKFDWIICPQRRLVCYCAMYLINENQVSPASTSIKLHHIFLFNDLIIVAAEISPHSGSEKNHPPIQRIFKPPIELLFEKEQLKRLDDSPNCVTSNEIVGCMGFTKDVFLPKENERHFVEVCSFSIHDCCIRSEEFSNLPYAISIWQQKKMTKIQPNESYWHCLIKLASVTQTDYLRFLKDLNSIFFEANLSRTALNLLK